ncbi:MAG: hypothetical protein A2Y65_07660 [Deltaproteobacteria bacterium RBG_13_52_11]|nr:MAG: hypothetical protein A2Y65_07660 [Deltaproteobacteria bacterium RBG_13_52_11]
MSNRRKSKRLAIAVPLRIKLLGISKHPQAIVAVTRNICSVGISTELQVTLSNGVFFIKEGDDSVNLIPYLVLENKEVELEITIPPHKEKIRARGKIIWYDFSSREALYYFGAGIFLKDMEVEDRKRWEEFARKSALETGKIWHHIQIAGTFTFGAGVVIFLAGFLSELVTTAKIGIFLSLIGLIGFVIAWWQHRSFMLLKKFKLF